MFNPQQQFRVSWPAEPVVARAYVDQLDRAGSVSEETLATVNGLLDRAEDQLRSGSGDRRLGREVAAQAEAMASLPSEGPAASQIGGLTETLEGIAARLM